MTVGAPTPREVEASSDLGGLAQVLEWHSGAAMPSSSKGEPQHFVYRLERLASIDGKEPKVAHRHQGVSGTVVRFNYARHGCANGVVLDNGDFIHTRPDGYERLALKNGDKVDVEGEARPLATGTGRVIEARRINGRSVGPPH